METRKCPYCMSEAITSTHAREDGRLEDYLQHCVSCGQYFDYAIGDIVNLYD